MSLREIARRLMSEEAGDPSAMNTLAAKLSQSRPHAKAEAPNSTHRTNGAACHGLTNPLCGLCSAGPATALVVRNTPEWQLRPFAFRQSKLLALPATDGFPPSRAFCSGAHLLTYCRRSSSDAAALYTQTRGKARGEIDIVRSPQENNGCTARSRPRDISRPHRIPLRCAAAA